MPDRHKAIKETLKAVLVAAFSFSWRFPVPLLYWKEHPSQVQSIFKTRGASP